MLGLNSNISNLNFKQNSDSKPFKSPAYTANQFITDLTKQEEKRLKGGFIARNFGSPTAFYGTPIVILLGELACLGSMLYKKKTGFLSEAHKKAFKNKILCALAGSIAAGVAFGVAVQSWQNKIINKKSSKPQEYLEKYGSDTSAKLADKNLRSVLLAAQYNPINGVIEINRNYIHDPYGKKLIEKCVKHELQHARQFEMIACLDNGLEKLNFASIYPSAQYMKNNPLAFAQFKDIVKDINNDQYGLYDNIKVPMTGAEVDLKKYIKAIDIIINNPEAKPEDIPMLIDVEHYKKAIAKRGVLSEKEKSRAEEYYQAMLKYPLMTGANLMNPFSGYRSNILEKEARKASKSKTGKIDY